MSASIHIGRPPVSLEGQRFGRIVAQSSTDRRVNGSVVWVCKCDCGATFERRSSVLLSPRKSGYPQFCSKNCTLRAEPREKRSIRLERARIIARLHEAANEPMRPVGFDRRTARYLAALIEEESAVGRTQAHLVHSPDSVGPTGMKFLCGLTNVSQYSGYTDQPQSLPDGVWFSFLSQHVTCASCLAWLRGAA